MNLLIIIGVIASLLFIFVVWRILTTASGLRKRDSKVIEKLKPIIDKLESKKLVNKDEVLSVAHHPETRLDLHKLLSFYKKQKLFPEKYLNKQSMGESALTYWLLHPTEYGKIPTKLEYVTTVEKELNNKGIEYLVYKFFNEDTKRWEIGVAGPFLQNQEPYAGYPGTFSTFEPFESKTPEEHVKWVHSMMIKKNMYRDLEN